MLKLLFIIFLIILLNYPIGYVLCRKFIPRENQIIAFPVYLSVGIAVSSCVLTAIYILNIFILIIFYAVPWVIILKIHYKDMRKKKIKDIFASIKNIKTFDKILPLILFSFLFINIVKILITSSSYGIYLGGLGDSQHGAAYVSAMIKSGTTYYNYPTGAYILSAALTILTGIAPGEALHITTAIVFILIPCLIYTVVYYTTKSCLFSMLAFLLCFYIPGTWWNMLVNVSSLGSPAPYVFQYVFFDFYNQSFARIWGCFMGIIFFLISYCIIKHQLKEEKPDNNLFQEIKGFLKSKPLIMESLCIGLLLSASIYTYADYAPIIAIFMGVIILLYFLMENYRIILIFVLGFIFGIVVSVFYIYLVLKVGIPINMPAYSIPAILGISIVAGGFLLLGLYIRIKKYELPKVYSNSNYIVYLGFPLSVILFHLILNTNLVLDPVLFWIITPFQFVNPFKRIMEIFLIASYLTTPLVLYTIASFISVRRPNLYQKLKRTLFENKIIPQKLHSKPQIVLILGVTVAFSPFLWDFIIKNPAPYVSEDDVKAFQWIDGNVPESSLLANDPYYYGLYSGYILSFSMKNISYFQYLTLINLFPEKTVLSSGLDTITLQLFNEIIPAKNYALAYNTVITNNIKFIYVTNMRGNATYTEHWDNFTSLYANVQIGFQSGNARVITIT